MSAPRGVDQDPQVSAPRWSGPGPSGECTLGVDQGPQVSAPWGVDQDPQVSASQEGTRTLR